MLPKITQPPKAVGWESAYYSPPKGSMSERISRLSKPQHHQPPARPPTVGTQTKLPGLNTRYRQSVRTPTQDRSASERTGHAGMVTIASRKLLDESILRPLLDMAAGSLSAESQMLAVIAIISMCISLFLSRPYSHK